MYIKDEKPKKIDRKKAEDAAGTTVFKRKKIGADIALYAAWSLFVLIVSGCNYALMNPVRIVILIAGFAGLSYLILKGEDKDKKGRMLAVITIVAIAIRTFYVIYTGAEQRQHDMGEFDVDLGLNYHGEYIEYLLENHKLLNENIMEHWQFYHPPLQHILSAVFFGIYRAIVPSFAHNWDAIQTLSLFYSLVTLAVMRGFTDLWKLSPEAKSVSYLTVALHPQLIVFAGAINNDPLSVMFVIVALYLACIWYQGETHDLFSENSVFPRLSLIKKAETKQFILLIGMALCIGLGMMAKLSAGMIAFPIGFLMLKVFFKSSRKARTAAEYLAFIVICAPLGLWYQIRSYILWKVPLTYVAVPDTEINPGLVINAPAWGRFLGFGDGVDYNIITETLDAAVFDGDYYRDHVKLALVGYFLLIAFGLFTVTLLANFIVAWVKERNLMNLVMTILLVTQLASYVYFCFSYPYTCTMSFRYIVPTIVAAAYYTGRSKDISPHMLWLVTKISVYAVAVTSLAFYCLVWTKDLA